MNFIAPDYKKGYYDVQLRGSIQKQSISVAKKKCREYMISKADVLVSYNKTSGSDFLENTEGKDVIKINM